MLNGSLAAKIVFKALKFQVLALVPRNQLIGAGSDGLGVEIMAAFDQIRRKDGVSMVAKVGKKSGLRAVRGNLYRIIIHNLDRSGGHAVLGNLGRFLAQLQGSLNIFRRHLFAVMEQNALL